MKRSSLWIILVIIVIAASIGGFLLWRNTTQDDAQEERTAVVEQNTLRITVTASGRIEPANRVDLSFTMPGRVVAVPVDLGDEVREGQLLAQLDETTIQLSLRRAEAGLAAIEAQFANLLASPRAEERSIAATNLEKAKLMLDQAQGIYDIVAWRPEIGMLPQSMNLQQTTLDYQNALANYNLTIRGATEEDIALIEAQIAEAEIGLEMARNDLENTALVAPFDGLIAAVNVTAGEMAPTGLPAISLVDPSAFRLTINVDELDVVKLEIGLPVEIAIDALPDQAFNGSIERIGPAATFDGGAVSYPVVIALDTTEAPVLTGMSATATIMVEEITNQLMIPNWIVRIDQTTGQTYVHRQTDGEPERVDVNLGSRYGGYSQVLGGLELGDVLVLVQNNGFFGGP